MGLEELLDSFEVSDILRMEATSVIDLGRRFGMSYDSNEPELLQQVLRWEANEAGSLEPTGIPQKTSSSVRGKNGGS